MKKHILVIDDDIRILKMFERILAHNNFQPTTCISAYEAIDKMKQNRFDLIISDQTLNEMDGIELLAKAQEFAPDVPFILITGYGSIERAVEAVKKGAFDYILKPFGRDDILKAIDRAMQESAHHRNKIASVDIPTSFQNIIGKSKKMQELFSLVVKIAPSNATVLIQGESGTGKELIARAIHESSPRKENPFIAINCGVLSENLLENELFGHVKGAFTGAIQYKKGLFEEADKGTLFLDEVADIPPAVQTKLLRVLQEKEFKPLGSNEIIKVDVRVIAATNVNLYKCVEEKRFRDDLYYRLAVIPIFVPSLKERAEDIPELALYFMQKYGKENGKNIKQIAQDAMQKLKRHHWQGNVRELENTIERAVTLADSTTITSDILWQGVADLESLGLSQTSRHPQANVFSPNGNLPVQGENSSVSLSDIVFQNTREAMMKALQEARGNRSKAAKMLGISRATLYNKLKQYGLVKDEKEA